MKYYPAHLNIENRRCLVVGGGAVGARKAQTLVKAGGNVAVVSPLFCEAFDEAPLKRSVLRIERAYLPGDMADTFLVIAATDNPSLNRSIALEAGREKVLCNIADAPESSDFILPSIVERGDLLITVSTSGKSPALAKIVRQELEAQFGDEYTRFLIFMGRLRKKLLETAHDPANHGKIFRKAVLSDLISHMATRNSDGFEQTLETILNPEKWGDLTPLYGDLLTRTAPMEDAQ